MELKKKMLKKKTLLEPFSLKKNLMKYQLIRLKLFLVVKEYILMIQSALLKLK